jgi:glycosyltransferase involved in cell wall biosynthesis
VRILEVVVRYPPFVGGVEASVHEVARRLAARGHQVRAICADDPPDSPAEVDGVQVVRLPWRFKAANTNLCFGLGDAIRRERPDVIHTHIPTAFFAGRAASAAREMGVPLVLTYHNDVAGEGIKGWIAAVYNSVFLPRLLEASDRIVATNPRYSPRLSNPIVIPWGVDTDRFHPPAEEPGPPLTVGFLSLLDVHHRYKGLEVLFEALRLLPAARLRVGGKGEDAAFYRRRAEEIGVADRVDFLGFVEDLNAFYGGCHVFALPSTDVREGFGLVLLEAMACGRPVVTTPIVGMAADIEQRRAGVVVPPDDPAALAAAVLWNREDLPGMGRRARSLVEERYTWERATLDYERLFAELGRTVRPGI